MNRNLTINGAALTDQGLAQLEQVEQMIRFRLPDGAYWYDARCGAAGMVGGPCGGFLPPRLDFGAMPAGCSGGGTNVFINGRELHPQDVVGLQQIVGAVVPGRYWVDEQGNAGLEGEPAMINLVMAARQRGGGAGGAWSHTTDYGTGRAHVGGDSSFLYFSDSKGNSFYVDR